MKVIVCGGGQVGYNIASYLADEDNDVTVIDIAPSRIAAINEELDVNGVVGHASSPDVLNAANAKDADMLIAVTQLDEVNMVACQIGHSLFGIPKKIARIREQTYLRPAWSNLFSRAHMPIDVIISPEVVIAEEVYKRLSVPGASFVSSLSSGLVHLLGVVFDEAAPIINTPIGQIYSLFPDLSFKIVSIIRGNEEITPSLDEQILPDDEVFFLVDTQHLKRVMVAFGKERDESRKIIILGGGQVGFGVAKLLAPKGRGAQVKIIEQSEQRAQYLSETLENGIVLHGSSLNKDVLKEAGISSADTVVAVTNDDESNILSSLLAKQNGCAHVVTLVNNAAYSSLVGKLGVDTVVSPRSIIVSRIMQHVRRGRIKGLHSIRDGFSEVIEAEISDVSKIVNMSLAELELPEGMMVATVVRDDEVIIPENDFVIREDDHVIVVATHEEAANVDNLFSVKVDMF